MRCHGNLALIQLFPLPKILPHQHRLINHTHLLGQLHLTIADRFYLTCLNHHHQILLGQVHPTLCGFLHLICLARLHLLLNQHQLVSHVNLQPRLMFVMPHIIVA